MDRIVTGEVTEVEVLYGKTVHIGDTVRHSNQRYQPHESATVTGFAVTTKMHHPGQGNRPWYRILVDHKRPETAASFPNGFDWDRTELVEPI